MANNVIELQLENGCSDKKEILRMLLQDPYFDMLKSIIKDGFSNVKINVNGQNTLLYNISYLVKRYDSLLMDEDTEDRDFDRILSLRDLTNLDKFISKFKNKSFTVTIDNFEYKIKFKDIIECLLLSDNDYKLFLNGYRDNKIPIDCFLYAVQLYMSLYEIDKKYVLPDHVLRRLNTISSSNEVDIEAINKIGNTTDCRLRDVYVDQNFANGILKSIPKDLSQLEKAIYLYILLCKTLTYDPVYFAYDQTGERNAKHRSINYISKINKRNNRVVCYEFNSLYGYLLNELGIHYETSYTENDEYGRHASLDFRTGKFIVNADAVTSILSGDLVNAKIDHKLNGLLCLNNNPDTAEEFANTKERIYSMFKQNQKQSILRTFRESVNVHKMNLDQKVDFIVKKSIEKKLAPIDNLGYLIKLKKTFLSEEELENFSFIIVRYNGDPEVPLRGIFTVKDGEDYHYYVYKPNSVIVQASKDIINDMFVFNDFEYLANDPDRIPGLHDLETVESTELLGDYAKILKRLSGKRIN